MRNERKTIRAAVSAFAILFSAITVLSGGRLRAEEQNLPEEAQNITSRELYHGVTLTSFELSADSKYGLNKVSVVEFDPAQSDLYIDVTNMAEYSDTLKTVEKTVAEFNEKNGEGKTAIAAVNGDLWMVSYAHARVEGSGTTYGGYSDAVVTKSLTIPRGFNMYGGEIITSAHMSQETPFEGAFQSFGFTADNKPYLGQPAVTVNVKNVTQNTDAEKVDGINRLPAKNALVMYTDKGALSHYALDEAYEVVIDCAEEYVVKHGAAIRGTVTAICREGDEDLPMQANRIILTARGSRPTSRIESFQVGDEIEITVSVKDLFGNDEAWQNEIVNAVGGHMVFARDGKYSPIGDSTAYPTTILAETNSGSVLFIQNDGRQADYSLGFRFSDYTRLAQEFDIKNGFILDGGGSSTLVALADSGYELVNRPSDKDENGNYGQTRSVVNSVILSYGKDRNAPEEPENATEAPAETAGASAAGSSGIGWKIALIAGSVVCFILAVLLALRAGNKKYGKDHKEK